ncbi:hypothetical protein RZS08_32265, partial [Arthrospira platensis SPKY1]|nr:hypothetical protein [Arthrospira platensis SPKY1]
DPLGMEGAPGQAPGLGWLDIDTTLEPDKRLRQVAGKLTVAPARVGGYEIHLGVTRGEALTRPLVHLDDGRSDGAVSEDGLVAGTYVHGLMDQAEALSAILGWAGVPDAVAEDIGARREADLNRLADAVERHLDLERLLGAAQAFDRRGLRS